MHKMKLRRQERKHWCRRIPVAKVEPIEVRIRWYEISERDEYGTTFGGLRDLTCFTTSDIGRPSCVFVIDLERAGIKHLLWLNFHYNNSLSWRAVSSERSPFEALYGRNGRSTSMLGESDQQRLRSCWQDYATPCRWLETSNRDHRHGEIIGRIIGVIGLKL
ncbi:hypothetical protein Tco_0599459 [Tanacetum coccineum]